MVNILICGNKGVFDGALTELISITNKTNEAIRCFVFTMDASELNDKYLPIEDKQIDFLNKVVQSKNRDNIIIKKDVTDIYKREFSGSKNEDAYCTPYTLLRLFADLVDDIPDKILYLDIDMMINGDIKELYNIDVSNYEYAAVKEKYGCWVIRPDYINAGMLLFNMEMIRQTGLLRKSRELIKKKKLIFADQSAVFLTKKKKKLINRKYNEQSRFNDKRTLVCHFAKRLMFRPYPHTENYKQWNVKEVHEVLKCHMFDDDLNEYLKLKEKKKKEYC